jgi:hypothetical protein
MSTAFILPRVYALRRMLWVPPAMIALFGAGAWVAYRNALSGQRGITLFGLFRIPAEWAVYVHWSMFISALAFVAFGLVLLVAVLQGKRTIKLSKLSITLPKFSLSGIRHMDIPLSSIQNISVSDSSQGLIAHIHHAQGKYVLLQRMMGSEQEFREVCEFLSSRGAVPTIAREINEATLMRDQDKPGWHAVVLRNLVHTNEGRILLLASAFYITVSIVARYQPVPFSPFNLMLFKFMPVFILLVYIKGDGLKRSFETSKLGTFFMAASALIPAIVSFYSRFAR